MKIFNHQIECLLWNIHPLGARNAQNTSEFEELFSDNSQSHRVNNTRRYSFRAWKSFTSTTKIINGCFLVSQCRKE